MTDSYQIQYIMAWILFLATCLLTLVIATNNPADLGLSPVEYKWLVILNGAFGLMQAPLPKITQASNPATTVITKTQVPKPPRQRRITEGGQH